MTMCKRCQVTYDGVCKKCSREKSARWRSAHPGGAAKAAKRWRERNPELAAKAVSAWRAKNPDWQKSYMAEYGVKNRARLRANDAARAAGNPTANRVKLQNRRARKRANGGKLSPNLAQRLLVLQKGKCACCHKSLDDGYHLDHNMPLALGGSNEDSNIQLLCPLCNLTKGARHPVEFMQQKGLLL